MGAPSTGLFFCSFSARLLQTAAAAPEVFSLLTAPVPPSCNARFCGCCIIGVFCDRLFSSGSSCMAPRPFCVCQWSACFKGDGFATRNNIDLVLCHRFFLFIRQPAYPQLKTVCFVVNPHGLRYRLSSLCIALMEDLSPSAHFYTHPPSLFPGAAVTFLLLLLCGYALPILGFMILSPLPAYVALISAYSNGLLRLSARIRPFHLFYVPGYIPSNIDSIIRPYTSFLSSASAAYCQALLTRAPF